jgi:hypothetical protein
MNEVLSDSPLAYYQFEETSGAIASDSSGNGHDGTYIGDPALATVDIVGHALALDGVDDRVALPDLGTHDQISIELIVEWSGTKTEAYNSLYSDYGWDESTTHFVLDPDSKVNPGTWSGNTVSPDPLDTVRHHLVSVLDGVNSKVILYVDGVEVNSNDYAVAARALTQGSIGAWDAWGTVGRYLQGTVDEVALYGTVLSPERVAAHAAAVPEPSSLVLLVLAGVAVLLRRKRG